MPEVHHHERMVECLNLGGYEKTRYGLIAEFFKEKKGNFLDVGCCQGGLKKYLNTDLIYYGIDNADNEFEGFKKVDLNARRLPFEDQYFDAVNCSATLEHLLYPLEMLREIKRVLKTDGHVLVSLPNDKSLNSLYAQLFSRIRGYDESVFGHHWRFSIGTAREFFEKEFRIIRERPEFGPLFRKYLPFLKIKPFCTEWFMLGVKR
ncbi:MAG: class I SAM-dependent methyltransferase [Candidatus Omnitrophica bacterium]|nr:class I SAM-dependent methyltransferase [Candidatus Omnitrophota bacterium]